MRRLFPLAVLLSLTACAAGFPSAPPIGRLLPMQGTDVNAWIVTLLPATHTTLRFNWVLNQDEGKGRGSVGLAPRDSLVLAYAGSLGFHPGTAFVLGDTAVCADPKEDVEKLVPSYELLWGAVGVPRPPRPGWKVEGSRDAVRTTWRYTHGADTTTYVLWRAEGVLYLQTTIVLDGKRIGTVVTGLDAQRKPMKARLDAPGGPAQLDLSFYQGNPLTFDREMWLAPCAK